MKEGKLYMACITCPECGKEVSSEAKTCIHCGYPLKKKNPIIPAKVVTIICVIALVLVYFTFFHLDIDDRYVYELVIEDSTYFRDPQSIRVLSGSAGINPDDNTKYAFLRISSKNAYGAKNSGYYIFREGEISDVSDEDLYVSFCNEKRINTRAINVRLMLYWIF